MFNEDKEEVGIAVGQSHCGVLARVYIKIASTFKWCKIVHL